MRFISTRAKGENYFSASEAILKGLAPDGGLFIPERIPAIPKTFTLTKGAWYAMYQALIPYFEGDELEFWSYRSLQGFWSTFPCFLYGKITEEKK